MGFDMLIYMSGPRLIFRRQLLPALPQLLPAPHHFYVMPKVSLAEYIKRQSGEWW